MTDGDYGDQVTPIETFMKGSWSVATPEVPMNPSWSDILAALDSLFATPETECLRIVVDVWMSHAVATMKQADAHPGLSAAGNLRTMFVQAAALAVSREEKAILLLAMKHAVGHADAVFQSAGDVLADSVSGTALLLTDDERQDMAVLK